MKRRIAPLTMLLLAALPIGGASAADMPTVALTIRNHQFEPATVTIPAGVKAQLRIKNMDATTEEFDSETLHREKVIAPGDEGVVYVGPLEAGTYPFMGEFHAATAKGEVVVK